MKTKLMLCPVQDLDAAVAFYRDVLGLPVKFRDGGRYCALDAGGYTLGLVAGEERIVDQAAPVFQVDALEDAMEIMLRSGATTLSPAERGPHEARAVMRAPGGCAVVLSAPLQVQASLDSACDTVPRSVGAGAGGSAPIDSANRRRSGPSRTHRSEHRVGAGFRGNDDGKLASEEQ